MWLIGAQPHGLTPDSRPDARDHGFVEQVAADGMAVAPVFQVIGAARRPPRGPHGSISRYVSTSAPGSRSRSAVRSGQDCLGGHQVSRADPGCSVRLPLAWASTGVDCGRGSVRSDCCPSRAIGKDRCCGGPFRLALQKEPPDVCPVSRIGHPCGNLHRAGLTGRPLAGVPSDLRCSRLWFRFAPYAL